MTTTLITGASAGLGEAFATALAARGDTLILTARRTDRLDALATRLRASHGVAVTVLSADLADPVAPAQLLADIAAAGLSVDLLINNAGFGARGDFAVLDGPMQAGMIDLNCRALVALSHGVLPAMIARGSGGILNVASIAAFQPGPWMSVYYATKAFVLSFSEGLHEEVKAHGIHVSALCPGPTRTEFADVAGMADSTLFQRFASDVDAVVRDGLSAIATNRAVAISGRMNAVAAHGVRFMPRGIARRLAGGLQRAREH